MEFCPSSGQIFNTSTTPDPTITKAFKVFNFIVGKGGEIVLTELVKHPSPLKDLSEAQAVEWLKGFFEQVQGDQPLEKPCFNLLVNSNRECVVKVCLRVKLCSNYETKLMCAHGNDCLQWHVCRGYLDDTCKNKLCLLSHNLLDEQNIQKAQKHKLEKHPTNSIRKVLAKNLPFVCEKYVNGNCTTKVCHDLHLCPRYARGICKDSNQGCPFSHDIHFGNNRAIFKHFGVPTKYVLAHVLLPKSITVPEEAPSEDSVSSGKKAAHSGKVNNLNNLNSESDIVQLVDQNLPMNINRSKHIASHKKLDTRQQVNSPLKQEKPKQKPKKSDVTAQICPQPLMSLPVQSLGQLGISFPRVYPVNPVASQPIKPFPSPNSTNIVQPQHNAKQKKNPKSKSDSQHNQMFGSRDSLVVNDDEQSHLASGAKPKQKQKKVVEAQGSQEETCSTANMALELSDENNPKKRRSRPRRKQKVQDESTDKSQEVEDASMLDLIEDTSMPDLIDFDEDDLDEGKLVDLDYDYSDPGLSQMSDSQAQAMWDLFSKNLLVDDLSLSQSTEQFPSLDSLSLVDEDTPADDKIRNASVRGIFNFVVKHNGTVSFTEVCNNPELWDPRFTKHEEWFRKHPSWFLLVEDTKGSIDEVKAISFKAKMCFKYNGRVSTCTQEKCPHFHICKEYIINGICSNFHGSCKKNHGFKDSHNKAIASKLFPDNDFTAKQLRQVIISSMPQVCMDYNNLRCKKGNKCLKVHICKNTGYRRCPKGECKLAHENGLKSPKTKALLAKYGVRFYDKINLHMLARTLLVADNGMADVASKPNECVQKKAEKPLSSVNNPDRFQCHIKSPAVTTSPICLAFLVGKCNKGTKCSDHHCLLPYQWVYLSGQQWLMLNHKENEELEKIFCEDNINDECVVITLKLDLATKPELSYLHNIPYIYNVNLKTMTIESLDNEGVQLPVKRLSTESDIIIPGHPLATTWHWYWKDEYNVYVEYQPRQGCKEPTSTSIEKFYQEGLSRYDFHVGHHDYRIYFKDLYQKNLDGRFLTKREVMRRPKFVSPAKVNQLKRSCALAEVDFNNQIPNHWQKMRNQQPFLLKKLNTSSKEFKNTQSLFINSMGDYEVTVHSIDRVQNPFMWEKYRRKKEQMERHSNKPQVDERQLFHGTSYKNIRSICKENFDWRLYGEVTGNKYGEGAYFARDASFSHNYCCDDEDGFRYVFIARVLVGSFTKGEKNYRRPPLKNPDDPHSDHFDSCVDNASNPQVFVGFDVDQYYPEYVIEYKCQPIATNTSSYSGYGVNIPARSNLASYSAPIGQHVSIPTSPSSSTSTYSPSPSPIGQRVPIPTHASGSMSYHQDLLSSSMSFAQRKMNEEVEKFERSAKKGDSCAVM